MSFHIISYHITSHLCQQDTSHYDSTQSIHSLIFCPSTPLLLFCLQDSSEWCEFCICRKCGGKNLPKESKTTRSSVNSDGIAYPDSSPELLLLAGLLACALGVMFYAGDRPYRHLYLMGVACTLYCFTDACNFFSTLFP